MKGPSITVVVRKY